MAGPAKGSHKGSWISKYSTGRGSNVVKAGLQWKVELLHDDGSRRSDTPKRA